MALTKYKLGQLIQLEDERNSDGKFTLDDVKGISIQKVFIETKADMQDVSLTPYILVKPDFFAYVTVTSRNGGKITLAHNDTKNTYIVSSSYVVFSVRRTDLLNSDYLFMYFNRPEFDRYARFNMNLVVPRSVPYCKDPPSEPCPLAYDQQERAHRYQG